MGLITSFSDEDAARYQDVTRNKRANGGGSIRGEEEHLFTRFCDPLKLGQPRPQDVAADADLNQSVEPVERQSSP